MLSPPAAASGPWGTMRSDGDGQGRGFRASCGPPSERAMSIAMLYPEDGKPAPGRRDPAATEAETVSVSLSRVKQARQVLRWRVGRRVRNSNDACRIEKYDLAADAPSANLPFLAVSDCPVSDRTSAPTRAGAEARPGARPLAADTHKTVCSKHAPAAEKGGDEPIASLAGSRKASTH